MAASSIDISAASSSALRALTTSVDRTTIVATVNHPDKHIGKHISLIKKREKCKQFPKGCKRERFFVPYLSKMMDSAANPRKALRDAIKQGGKKGNR